MKYYVYELVIVPDGTVCYVGKGSGRRMYNHKRYALRPPSKTQSYLYSKLSEVLASGKNFEPHMVFETDDEIAALVEEKRRIQIYGLENLFNWGDCHTGPLASEIKTARKAAMRNARLKHIAKLQQKHGYKMPPEVTAKISAANKGRKFSAETIKKIQASRSKNPELQAWLKSHCHQMSESLQGKKQSPEHVAKMAASHRGLKRTPEQLETQSKGRHMGLRGGPKSKSNYRGVSWQRSGTCWQSRISILGESTCMGYFKLEIDAAWAYDNEFYKRYGIRPNNTPKDHKITRFKHGQRGKLIPVDN